MTKIIGLTGGIGSGKTTVAKLLESEGIPVYISDEEAKKILDEPKTIKQLISEFGNDIILNGKVDRKKLSEIVFNSADKLKKLNSIIHPLVKTHFDKWVLKNSHLPFVVKEAAILFESGSYKYCDIIITVTADIEIRIQRVMDRDKVSRDQVLDRIKNQWTDEERIKHSDFVIKNENFDETRSEVQKILQKIKNPQKI